MTPTDVLLCIFSELHALETHAGPELLSSVCGHWRSVALEAPFLWTNLIFKFPPGDSFLRQRKWLSRSGRAPLDIIIRDEVNVDPDFDEDSQQLLEEQIDEMFTILRPHSSRWRSFLGAPGTGAVYIPILMKLEEMTGMSQIVKLAIRNTDVEVSTNSSPVNCLNFQSLRHLEMWWFGLDMPSLQRLSGLESLYIMVNTFTGAATMYDVIDVNWPSNLHSTLQCLPLLQDLTIEGVSIGLWTSTYTLPIFTLPDLKSMVVEDSALGECIYTTIRLPRINTFVGSVSMLPSIILHDLLPGVEDVTLERLWSDVQLLDVSFTQLQYFTHLHTLTLRKFSFQALGELDEISIGFPLLRVLILSNCSFFFGFSTIKRCISGRTLAGHAMLDKLTVYRGWEGWTEEDREWLRENVVTLCLELFE